MKKLILMGRSGHGKTSLMQALKGQDLTKIKTQYISYGEYIIDTPGEYLESGWLGHALALYAYEADIVGLIMSATETMSMYPPAITCMVNREVIGIVTKIDEPCADIERAKNFLTLAGCQKIFCVSAVTKQGVQQLLEYLSKTT